MHFFYGFIVIVKGDEMYTTLQGFMINPIKDRGLVGGSKQKASPLPYQFFPCIFYKRID